MTLRDDLTGGSSRTGHASQHNQITDAILALQAGGFPVVRKFPFAYNTSGLAAGHAVYTPTVGDVLLDAWIQVTTGWDGTTPFGDIGTFVSSGGYGLWGNFNSPIDMNTAAADDESAGTGLLLSSVSKNGPASLIGATGGTPGNIYRVVPALFTVANPIKVVVSQDGKAGSASPGATHGAAILYLVTATPI